MFASFLINKLSFFHPLGTIIIMDMNKMQTNHLSADALQNLTLDLPHPFDHKLIPLEKELGIRFLMGVGNWVFLKIFV